MMANITLGLLLSSSLGFFPYYSDIHLTPAVDIACETVNEAAADGRYLNFTLSYVYRDVGPLCGIIEGKASRIASDLYIDYGVHGFIGPPCPNFDTISVGDLASHWNLPLVSGASQDLVLDNKARFTTLTRTSYLESSLFEALLFSSSWFDWQKLAIFYDDGYSLYGLWFEIQARLHYPEADVYPVHLSTGKGVTKALQEVLFKTRSKFATNFILCVVFQACDD